MAQNTQILLPSIAYSRADYTALRAHCLRIPLATIADLYYSEDSPQLEQGLERFLLGMRNDLIQRAIEHNPALAHSLQAARQGGALTTRALAILIEAANLPKPVVAPHQPLSLWFRPRTVAALKHENLSTISDLMLLIKKRGINWWRAVPRIGQQRAQVIVNWLLQHEALGMQAPLPENSAALATVLYLDPLKPGQLAPLGHFITSEALDGSHGLNRAQQFCFIQARNDLQAISFYLSRFQDQPHTLRAYRKELERFLLWSIMHARKPMSSLLVDDCEAYKKFLCQPSADFSGVKTSRFSSRWKPFTEQPISAKSQRHAIIIIRAAFAYLVGVRYLSGNPWIAVKDPSVTEQVNLLQIEKALPDQLWDNVIEKLQEQACHPDARQTRIALAAILLMGDSGLRREEVAKALKANLKPSQWGKDMFELRVLGKRNKLRDVPVSQRCMTALQAHWNDRNEANQQNQSAEPMQQAPSDQTPQTSVALICPLVIPQHTAAKKRHSASLNSGRSSDCGYHADGLYRLIRTCLKNLRLEQLNEMTFSPHEIDQLCQTTPHAFRHTFGTLAVANGMPLDVAQSVLGHASLATTGIYVQAKKKRMMEEAEKFFAQKNNPQ